MSQQPRLFDSLRELRDLRQQAAQQPDGAALDWERYLNTVKQFCQAQWVAVIRVDPDQPAPALFEQLDTDGEALARWLSAPDAKALLERVLTSGYALRARAAAAGFNASFIAMQMPGAQQAFILLIGLELDTEEEIKAALTRAGLVADILPDSAEQAGSEWAGLGPLLDVLSSCLQAQRFQTAGYSLVNGLVSAVDGIDQAVLGWREGEYIRARLISHYEKFERKTEQVRLMEAALEEAADQDTLIQCAQGQSESTPGQVEVAHQQLRAQLGAKELVTFPLHDAKGATIASLTLISFASSIQAQTISSAYFVAQTLLSHLQNLRRDEASLLQRLVAGFRRGVSRWFGGDNLWIKVATLVLSAALLLAAITPVTHRVSGAARLVTDEMRLLTAPWQGTVAEVNATSGDQVRAGDTLIVMDTEERLLQLAELQAELQRNQAELDRARAQFDNVDTAVAQARVAQTRARIAQVQRQVSQAVITTPLTGVVVEGDRRDLLSSPVNSGDRLMRVAELRGIYLLIDVAEEDVQFLDAGSIGTFSLVARPAEQINLRVERIIPMAQMREGQGAVFPVKASLTAQTASWWRPGMTGVARIDVGKRSALWVVGHKAWNRIRLWLWW